MVAMPYLYTTSSCDIFAPFHLKYAIPRQVAILLIAHGNGFVKTNLGKHNLAKLTNNQATQELKHPQCGPIIQDSLSLIIIFSHGPKLRIGFAFSNLQSMGINFDMSFGFNENNGSTSWIDAMRLSFFQGKATLQIELNSTFNISTSTTKALRTKNQLTKVGIIHSHFIKLAQRMESTLSHLIRHHSLTTKLCSLAMKVLSSLLSMPLSHHWYQQAHKHGQESSSAKLLTFYQQTSLFYGRGVLSHLNPDS